ncbi:MAG TPA: TIGR00282 family metallophosphoesterase [Gaiellales bacterium]|nr:TIGR00282 family metallophosphoesterase [Gaiellales bacterium]
MRLLFIADAFAAAGRRIIEERLPALRDERGIDFVVANAENVADGVGITSRLAKKLFAAGVDVITLGNHAYRQREVYAFLDADPRIVRPANYPASAPGRGVCHAQAADGTRVAVINLLGSLFLEAAVSPFAVAEELVADARREADVVVVDFHAEATSEKVAMGRLLAGRATAVVGTHTHVQTNDARVLDGGTAYITDAGMTGPHDSVIGVRTDVILRRFTTQVPVRFEPAEGDVRIEGVLIDCDGDGRATAIEAFRLLDSQ